MTNGKPWAVASLVSATVGLVGLAGERLTPGAGAIVSVATAAGVHMWWAKRRSAEVEKKLHRATATAEDAAAMPILTALLPADLPHSKWALCPAAIVRVLNEIGFRRHGTVVECGSGISTLLLAAKFRQLGSGHVWSIEHDADWAAYMHRLVERFDLQEWITLINAPLASDSIDGHSLSWYERSSLVEVLALPTIDVLLVDGPPAHTGRHNRFGALPIFEQQLHAGSLIVLDDAYRSGEEWVAEAWKRRGFTVRLWPTSRGQFELRKATS